MTVARARRPLLAILMAVALACSGGGSPTGPDDDDDGGGASTSGTGDTGVPAASTANAAVPAGCAGTAVGRVEININVPATVEVYGETFDVQQATGSAPYRIIRNVVPCEYVLTGSAKSPGAVLVEFLRASPYERNANPGGVIMDSVVTEQGNGQWIGNAESPCQLSLTADNGLGLVEFRVRFTVGSSNAGACL